jgi:hypothetical protein
MRPEGRDRPAGVARAALRPSAAKTARRAAQAWREAHEPASRQQLQRIASMCPFT